MIKDIKLSFEDVESILEDINKNFDEECMPKRLHPYEFKVLHSDTDNTYDINTTVIFWTCGGVILVGDKMYFFSEDDGSWFISDSMLTMLGSSWSKELSEFFTYINKYLEANGKPYYYSGTKMICGYALPIE